MTKNAKKTSSGLEPKLAAALSYVLGFISGLIFYLIETKDKYVRFHAMQSIITFGGIFLINIASFIIIFIFPWQIRNIILMLVRLVNLMSFILWVILIVKAYQGEKIKLPIAGDIAEKHS